MEMVDIINAISKSFLPGVLIFFICAAIILYQKEKIYRYPPNGWLNVKEYPIPDDITYYIATDGKEVDSKYGKEWGPHGELIFSKYKKTYITHWQPFPEAPK